MAPIFYRTFRDCSSDLGKNSSSGNRYSEYSEAPRMVYVPNTTLVASRSAFDLRLDTDS